MLILEIYNWFILDKVLPSFTIKILLSIDVNVEFEFDIVI